MGRTGTDVGAGQGHTDQKVGGSNPFGRAGQFGCGTGGSGLPVARSLTVHPNNRPNDCGDAPSSDAAGRRP